MKITPEKLYQADILVQPGQWSANADYAALDEATKTHYTIKAAYLNEHIEAIDRYLVFDLQIAADFESHREKNNKDIVIASNLLWLVGKMSASPQFTPEQQEALRLILANAEQFQK